MITKTYITKSNGIISGSEINTGINPVGEIIYGDGITRLLIYFDHNKIKNLVEDKTYNDIKKLKHVLKMTNCGSIDLSNMNATLPSSTGAGNKVRATSFDLIFFLIPKYWDGGRGFDYGANMFTEKSSTVSTDGCNWYQPRNGYTWDEDGIYSTKTLSKEYDNFSSESGSKIIIGRQHFDFGNEDICLDITNIVNQFIDGTLDNYGIGIAFSPKLEETLKGAQQYIGFFTPYTNTFFEPYVETTYNECIEDDRAKFFLDKNNKLYFYSNIGGSLENLDEMPTCKIDDIDFEVKQATKGVYYIDINLSSKDYTPKTMLYDVWGNIKYNGVTFDDVELDFVTKSNSRYFNFGTNSSIPKKYIPNIYGIKYDERIQRNNQIREVIVEARVPYTANEIQIVDDMEYRVYIMDGVRQYDVIPYHKVNRYFDKNSFILNIEELLPQTYYVDIKIKSGNEINNYTPLKFTVVSDITERYS